MIVWITLAFTLLSFVALGYGYSEGLKKRHALYTAALEHIKAGYEAEALARARQHYEDQMLFYVCGIVVGAFCVWAWLKWGRS